MIINVKYDIGDTVRYIEKIIDPVWEPCPCCNGKKYIIGADKEKYQCPNCEGEGKVEGEDAFVEKEKTGTIQTIHVYYNSGSCYDKPSIYYTIPQSVYQIQQEDILEKL